MKKILTVAAISFALAGNANAHSMMHAAHSDHDHKDECGHVAIEHAGHIDYLHGGHLHHAHDTHVDEHTLAVSSINPQAERLVEAVSSDDHMHGHDGEEHEVLQHGTHYDYVHNGRLHHVHGDHADDHGPVKLVASS